MVDVGLMPSEAIEAVKGISLGGAKYSEYEIDPGPPITELVYGEIATLESPPDPGEYPRGQRTAAVNRQAMPSQVRLLPPPCRALRSPGEDGDTTKFERSLGRSGQALMRPERQTTIPKRPFVEARIKVGERMRVRADDPGRIIFERIRALDLTTAAASTDGSASDSPAPESPA
jgi:hypothetical protein